jgi:hypothetical protein
LYWKNLPPITRFCIWILTRIRRRLIGLLSCGAGILGIKDGSYSSGRLGNYTDEPEKEAGRVCEEIARIKKCIESHPGAQPFDLIAPLMEK